MKSQESYDALHLKNINKYGKQVRQAYLQAIKHITQISSSLPLNSKGEFYFRNHSDVNKQVNSLLKEMYTNVYTTTISGINSEWDLAVEKNNEIAKQIYGVGLSDLPKDYRAKYLSNNEAARQNFINRKIEGLGLSDKVWNNTQQFKQELELALETGLGKGLSAESLARSVQQYLNDPDKLFRRVRNGSGELRLSKAAKLYNPGQGRYRSSFKNAFRLTRNEVNFSYEGSQYEKRQQQDFIVGVRIKVSPGHQESDDKGGISCTSLQGDYPKNFNFTYKWHVNCKCMSLNILKTKEELDNAINDILSDQEPSNISENAITTFPNGYPPIFEKYQTKSSFPRTFKMNEKLDVVNKKPINLSKLSEKDQIQEVKRELLWINGSIKGDRNSMTYKLAEEKVSNIQMVAKEAQNQLVYDIGESILKYMRASEKQAWVLANFAVKNKVKWK